MNGTQNANGRSDKRNHTWETTYFFDTEQQMTWEEVLIGFPSPLIVSFSTIILLGEKTMDATQTPNKFRTAPLEEQLT